MSRSIGNELLHLAAPVAAMMLPRIVARLTNGRYAIYAGFAALCFVILYFMRRGYYSVGEWREAISDVPRLIVRVVLTAVAAFGAYAVGECVSFAALRGADSGRVLYVVRDWPGLICFAVTTILLPAAAEETLFRKGFIRLRARATAVVVGAVVGSVLFGVEHSLTLWGALPMILVGLVFAASYALTGNIFVPMIAHFVMNLVANGATVISLALQLTGRRG